MFKNEFFNNLYNNPAQLKLEEDDLKNYSSERKRDIILGEYFAEVSKIAGRLAASFLYRGRWGKLDPEWFDHRIQFLYPEKTFNDHWCITAVNAIQRLPLGGTLLDLCSGDGFYPFYFYRKRAKNIDCVEIKTMLYKHSQKHYSAENINYICKDVLLFQPTPEKYDVVVIRGAIEHFSETNQHKIFQKAVTALKPNGWFVGDTPANPEKQQKILKAHENEWTNEEEMRSQLQPFFSHMETQTLISSDRTNLFWCCRK
ncbi:Methyltransferase type 11 domain protein [Candidatus Magnetomorum sp. HK-1]|nr:Methyltransferase type 11 domain protein [Candidatus Magnetomorum sp. HK-1]